MVHFMVVMRDEIVKRRKKKRIQKHRTLINAKGEEMIVQQNVKQKLESEMRQGKARSRVNRQALARYKRCRGQGNSSRTCGKDIVDNS